MKRTRGVEVTVEILATAMGIVRGKEKQDDVVKAGVTEMVKRKGKQDDVAKARGMVSLRP